MDTRTRRADPLDFDFGVRPHRTRGHAEAYYQRLFFNFNGGLTYDELTSAERAEYDQRMSVYVRVSLRLACQARIAERATAPAPEVVTLRMVGSTARRRSGGGRPCARRVARAASRGGDSGDDGSGEPEPGPESGRPLLYLAHSRYGRVNRALARALRRLGA